MSHTRPTASFASVALATAAVASGCGGGSGSHPAPQGGAPPGALAAESQSAATGDIPDNQNFLTFRDPKLGFSMSYPEGWAQKRGVRTVTFKDKNNLVRVAVERGPAPTVSSVQAELAKLKAKSPSLRASTPTALKVAGKQAVKVVYTTQSAPNPVTGKRVTLMVDRYEFARGGRVATVDLGTPKGVDNVDAYRMMSRSFRWR
jgi:hypothetical protein